MPESTFKNLSVIITGASSGIGRELARQLAAQCANLALAARQADKLEELAQACRALGAQALPIPTDVTDPEQCRALVERAAAAFGGVDVLINNAGITMWARLDEVSDVSIFEKIIRTNYLGSVYCTYYALPHLKRSRGRIVGISSLTGKAGVPTRTGYSASKHAMVGFFDSLRVELAGTGVSVTMIYPGFIDTGAQVRGFGPDGKPLGYNPLQLSKVMTTAECARICIGAIAARRREEVMTLRGKLGQWLKLIAPSLVDRIAAKAIREGK
jgi:NAD(P)-dependent dehydrogenase (short-subunit alcohol dehydrogenase family)